MWFFYVDDSANEQRMLLWAVAVPLERWTECLESWLELAPLALHYAEHGIPAGFEFHAGDFVTGRGNPAPTQPDGLQPAINTSKQLRRRLYRSALSAIAHLPIQIMTVHRNDTDKMAAYRELLARIEGHLTTQDMLGVLIVDGLDEGHRAEHRELCPATRRILEDPWMQPAHHSQFIQMADLVVRSAFQALGADPSRKFMWSWYTDLLEPVVLQHLDDVFA